jgi:parvulin-like peptidyl-prolyl isomerase
LLHFTLLGALVFAGHRVLSGPAEVPTLEVSAAKQRELTTLFEQRQGRAATDEERRQLVQRYVEDEVLFREGERLSLPQTDPMLRAQLLARVRSLLQAEVSEKPPTEPELVRYYDEHRGDYTKPETINYREYWFKTGPNAKDDARRLALALQRGEEPQGADLPSPINYTGRGLEELRTVQSPDLARRIWSLPTGVWRELPSDRGLHVVRVDERTPALDLPFARVRERVLAEYRKEQTSRAFQAEVARLTSQWRVRVAGQP